MAVITPAILAGQLSQCTPAVAHTTLATIVGNGVIKSPKARPEVNTLAGCCNSAKTAGQGGNQVALRKAISWLTGIVLDAGTCTNRIERNLGQASTGACS